MKFTVISLLAVTLLSVGPAGAIPVDSMQGPTTTEAMYRTDDAMPAAAGATLMSHNLGHNCTDGHGHGHGENEDVDPATATTAPGSDDEVTAWVKRSPPAGSGGTSARVSSPGNQFSSMSPQPGTDHGDADDDLTWIHGTCTKRDRNGVCHVTLPGENKEREFICSPFHPCEHLGSCVVLATGPERRRASCS